MSLPMYSSEPFLLIISVPLRNKYLILFYIDHQELSSNNIISVVSYFTLHVWVPYGLKLFCTCGVDITHCRRVLSYITVRERRSITGSTQDYFQYSEHASDPPLEAQ
jgi:hypothetical protein